MHLYEHKRKNDFDHIDPLIQERFFCTYISETSALQKLYARDFSFRQHIAFPPLSTEKIKRWKNFTTGGSYPPQSLTVRGTCYHHHHRHQHYHYCYYSTSDARGRGMTDKTSSGGSTLGTEKAKANKNTNTLKEKKKGLCDK